LIPLASLLPLRLCGECETPVPPRRRYTGAIAPHPPNPASTQVDIDRVIFIVAGASLRAEVADRPIAYWLQQRMLEWRDERCPGADEPGLPGARPFDVVVCSDLWWLSHDELGKAPTVSVGGPGVNALAAHLADKTPSAFVIDDTLIVQVDPDFTDLRASVWGRDRAATEAATRTFADRYLDRFMRAASERIAARD
jgi:hypothetical protein